MPSFNPSCHYDWFAREVVRHFRYSYEAEITNFLACVCETSEERKVQWPTGKILWRAQRGCLMEDGTPNPTGDTRNGQSRPYEYARMIPRSDRTTEGRVNPKGIPCLYLATDLKTAIAEVRPPAGFATTVATFELKRDLTLVDCSLGLDTILKFATEHEEEFLTPNPQKTTARFNWVRIDFSFSQPISNTDDAAEYAPTQVLAEEFRRHGYDGIVYMSAASEGKNVALFKIDDAHMLEGTVYYVNDIKYELETSRKDRRFNKLP